ncbi:hypothetical protein QQY24_19755 [Streptomyces sp. TG1A-8]|uniref:hypothetical protein n=1 Tax=Streptomyces sp. TG1A-8 TaxID=3051385 RepID=UPI00265BEDD9|nr:hypothetical protein [Streptomyces sp. TG1A-8]MDO0927539.1 hypothetical protein [Streptomyces sp. TG1A-8]
MTKFLLAVHVLAAIVAIGPVTVAASMFPPVARRALAAGPAAPAAPARPTDPTNPADPAHTLHLLHRICRAYAVVGVAVPVFGVATANEMGVLGSAWLIVSVVLTVLAALVLGGLVLPAQGTLVGGGGTHGTTVRLAMYTGVFNLLWAAVTVLMIVRPGSTTGA